jgi:6,7-dimethyl-8-ribityllumazine synthase
MTMPLERTGQPKGQGRRIALVVARFNEEVTSALSQGAQDALLQHGVDPDNVHIHHVPGSYELPTVAARLARSRRYDAVVCIGAVIRGETQHHDYISHAVAQALARIGAETGVPTLLGVVTTETWDQAVQRAGGTEGNRGADAALAALEMIDLLQQIGGE